MMYGSESPSDAYVKRVTEPLRSVFDQEKTAQTLPLEVLKSQAAELLPSSIDAPAIEAAYGGVGLLAQHTSYFNGFAVILGLSQATAVAIRPAALSSVVFQVDGEHLMADDLHANADFAHQKKQDVSLHREVIRILQHRLLPHDHSYAIAVAGTIPLHWMEASLAALAIATARSMLLLPEARKEFELTAVCHEAIVEALEAEFSKAYLMVSARQVPGKFAVIDTDTEELLPFDAPVRNHLCWGVVDAGAGPPHDVAFFRNCGELGEQALKLLRKNAFPTLRSFRDVEHRDLQQVLDSLPRKLRPITRHLINENKRVQSMIAAIRKEDWQKLGSLLLMSHSSLRHEWKGTNTAVDVIVDHVEGLGPEGMHGACMTGRSGSILMVGQPLAFVQCINELRHKRAIVDALIL